VFFSRHSSPPAVFQRLSLNDLFSFISQPWFHPFLTLALNFPFAARLMLSASSRDSMPVKYLNQLPELGSSISTMYVNNNHHCVSAD
jgi:hypothetical protein